MTKFEIIFVTLIAFSLVVSFPVISFSQTQSSSQPKADVPLSFFLKLKDESQNATDTGNQSQAKNATITVTLEKGPGGDPVELPVSAMVPSDTEARDLELCASLQGGEEMCQALDKQGAKIDLSSQGQNNQSSSNMSSTPTAYSYTNELREILGSISFAQTANAQLITVDDTTLNIPITVIIPITLQIQNAQICASVASSGAQTCQQIVMNPEQNGYTPVDIDLSTGETPTISTGAVESTQTTSEGGMNATTSTSPETDSNANASSSEPSASSSEQPSDTEQQPEENGQTENEPSENGNSDSETS